MIVGVSLISVTTYSIQIESERLSISKTKSLSDELNKRKKMDIDLKKSLKKLNPWKGEMLLLTH